MAELKRSSILGLVLPKDKTISEKQISLQEMPEKRENHTGYGAFSDVEPEDGTLTSVLLGEYVIDHFTDFTDGPKGGELDYELEYILAGRESDKGNLETVAKKLVMLRFVPNYIYLQTSSTKQAEARGNGAGTLCTPWQSRLLQRRNAGNPACLGIWRIRYGCQVTLRREKGRNYQR